MTRPPIAPAELSTGLARFLPDLEHLVDHAPVEQCLAVIGDLEELKARLWLRMIESSRSSSPPPATPTGDQLLSVEEAAQMLGVKRRWLRDHAHDIPARVELPGRVTRFSKRKLEKWIAHRAP